MRDGYKKLILIQKKLEILRQRHVLGWGVSDVWKLRKNYLHANDLGMS